MSRRGYRGPAEVLLRRLTYHPPMPVRRRPALNSGTQPRENTTWSRMADGV